MFVNNPDLNPDEYFEEDMEDEQSEGSDEDMSEEDLVHGKRERVDKTTFQIANENRRVRQKHKVIMSRHDLNVRDRVTFYGLPMKYEPIAGFQHPLTELTLECTEARWFNERVVNEGLTRRAFWKLYPTPPSYRITIMTGASAVPVGKGIQFKTQIPEQEQGDAGLVEEGNWYRISLTPDDGGGPYAMVEEMQPSLAMGPPIQRSIMRVDQIDDGNVLRTLKDVFHIGSGDVEPHVVGPPNASVAYVGINNVGQGNCIGLYGTDGRPFLYFDVGRSKSYASRPDTIKPCLAGSPSVILSHWDQDHYELGVSHPELRYLSWLCPAAEAAGISATFFNSLTHKRVWPAGQKRFEEYPWGFVLFASDADPACKNDAGICLLVRIADDPNAVNPRPALDVDGSRPQIFPDERYLLMTGDSMFQHLPSCSEHDLDGVVIGIVAAHHGSFTGLDGFEKYIPLAAEPLYDFPATVAYSLGIDLVTGAPSGGYGHPRASARNAYRLRGYHNVIMTNNPVLNAPFSRAQNIVLGWRRVGGAMAPANLAIVAARNNYDAVELTARQSRLDMEAVRTVRDAAKEALDAGNDPVVAGNHAIGLAAYTGKNPQAGTTAGLNLILNPFVAYPNDRAANNAIDGFDTAIQNTAVTDGTNAEPLAILLAAAVAANDPQLAAIQQVNCENAALAIAHPPSVMRPPPPPVTPLPGPAEVVAINAIPVTITESVGPSKVRHPKHGLITGDQVVFTCPGQAAFHGNQFAVNVLDENTYTVNVSTGAAVTFDATVTFSPATVTNNRNITDGGPTRTVVRLVGYDLATGTQVNISQATNAQFDGNHNFQAIDGDSFELTGFAANAFSLAGIWAYATGARYAFNNEPIAFADDGVGLTTVTHGNHQLRDQSTVTITGADPGLDGARLITVTGGDTYTFAATSGGVLNGPAQCQGRRQKWVEISTSAHVSTVAHNGHGLSTGDQVTIVHPLGGMYNGSHTITRIDANTYSIPIGDGLGNTVNLAVTQGARGFTGVNVIVEDPGRRTVVQQPNHGQVTGGTVTVANAGAYNGARIVTVLSRSEYTINHVTGVNQVVVVGTVTGSSRLVPAQQVVVSIGLTRGQALASVRHDGHELVTGMRVYINSALASANGWKTVTVTRRDYYQITLTAPPAASGRQHNVNLRWVEEFVPPPHGIPAPLPTRVVAAVADVDTSIIRKTKLGAAAVSTYQHEINPATCANHNCSFWDLHRV